MLSKLGPAVGILLAADFLGRGAGLAMVVRSLVFVPSVFAERSTLSLVPVLPRARLFTRFNPSEIETTTLDCVGRSSWFSVSRTRFDDVLCGEVLLPFGNVTVVGLELVDDLRDVEAEGGVVTAGDEGVVGPFFEGHGAIIRSVDK